MPVEIILSGDIGFEINARDLSIALKKAAGADVRFMVSSRGGLVFEGIEMFNMIREYPGHTESIITGIAASMGSYLVLAADKVTAFDNTSFMIHNALGLVFGNHNDMRKRANALEGISGILAREYAKKTGKTVLKIKALMDDETFMFGDEIIKAGFVDEILDSPEDSDKDKALAKSTAQASVELCLIKMRESEVANVDLEKAVAYVDSMALLMDINKTGKTAAVSGSVDINKTPADAGNIDQEDTIMTFAEFMAANLTEKVAYDAAMATARTEARTEGVTAAKAEMAAIVAKVSPILASDAYPAAVKLCGVKAITGEGSLAAFEAVVVVTDQTIEAAKEKAAADEQGAETAGAGGGDTVDAEAAAALDAKKARLKGGV